MSPSRENRLDKLRADQSAVTPSRVRADPIRIPQLATPPKKVKQEIVFDAPVLPVPEPSPPPPVEVKPAEPAKLAKPARVKPAPVVRVLDTHAPAPHARAKSDIPAPVVRVLDKRAPAKPAPAVQVLEIRSVPAKPVIVPVTPVPSAPAKPAPVNLVRSAYAKRAPVVLSVQEHLARRIAFDEAASLLYVDPLRDKAIEWADRPELANFRVAVTTNAGAMVHEAATRVAARGMFRYSRLRKVQVAAIYRRQNRG